MAQSKKRKKCTGNRHASSHHPVSPGFSPFDCGAQSGSIHSADSSTESYPTRKQALPEATKAILEVVENQLRDNNPPETRETLKRLQDSGLDRKEAVRLIACAVSTEIFKVLHDQETFDQKRFIANLNKLPTMPWD